MEKADSGDAYISGKHTLKMMYFPTAEDKVKVVESHKK